MDASNAGFVDASSGTPITIIAAGDTVVWHIRSGVHTVTSHLPGFSSGTIGSEETFSWTFDAGGVFPYRCSLHLNMQGVVVVQ